MLRGGLLALALVFATPAAHAQMPGDLVVTEIMTNPPGTSSAEVSAEWVELYNNTSHPINLKGWAVQDSAASGLTRPHIIASDVIVQPFSFVVLGGSTNPANNGGAPVAYAYGTSTLNFANSLDRFVISRPDGRRIDVVHYRNAAVSAKEGISRELRNVQSDNINIDSGTTWVDAQVTAVYGTGGRGTPGAAGQTLTPGAATFTRMIAGTMGAGNDQGWRLLSLPVQGGRGADLQDDVSFATGSGSVLYTHTGDDGDASGYVNAASDTSYLDVGRGFALYLFDTPDAPLESDLTLDVTGVEPYTDVGAFPLDSTRRWHLLGNPYDASFDVSALDLVGRGFQAGVQIWNPRTRQWEVITEDAGMSDVLTPWQGFFVERTTLDAGDTLVVFPYSGRTTGGTFIGKTGQARVAARFETRLALRNAAGALLASDAAAVELRAGTREGWDAYDASKLDPLGAPFATLALGGPREGQAVWQALRSLPAEGAAPVTMPLRVRTSAGGTATLTLPEAVPGWRVELLDARTGAPVDARSAATYTLTLDGPTDDATRLALRLTPTAATGVAPSAEAGVAVSRVWPNPARTSARLVVETAAREAVRVAVFDVLGREVLAQVEESLPGGRTEVVLPLAGLPAGAYVVRVAGDTWAQTRPLTVVR